MKRIILFLSIMCFIFSGSLSAKIVRSCNGFIFLIDESASMKEIYKGEKKVDIEKKLLKKINHYIPSIPYTSSMIAFSYKSAYNTISLYPVSNYEKEKMDKSINNIKAFREWTSIGYGLKSSEKDISKMTGRIHLVIFSDGIENSSYESPEKIAKKLKNKFPNLCIFAVQIGKDKYGYKVLKNIVDATGCGRVFFGESLNYEINFNNFIKDVFGYEVVEKKQLPTPKPKDSDKDGVYDKYDKCPGTPLGAPVDINGCWKIKNIYFDFDKYIVKEKYNNLINEVAHVLKLNPELKLEIRAYTDAFGTDKYNIKLSEKRAKAVKQKFLEKSLCPCRLIIKYFGEKYPVASNKTAKGRALNRRVELRILK